MKSVGAIFLVFFVFFIACSKDEDETNETVEKNNPPSMESQSFTVASTANKGTVLGVIEATDADEDELSYELVSVDTPFSVVKLKGELVLSDEVLLAKMDKKSYELKVKVSDGVDSVTGVVKVEVLISTNPEPTTPEPTNPEQTNPEPTNPEPTTPEPTNPEPTNPEPTTPEPTTPEPTTPEPTNPEPTNPEPTNPEPNPDPSGISEAEKKRLTDLFVFMAFRKSNNSPNTTIKKWNGDMKVIVTGSPTASDRTLVKNFLVTLNELATDNFNAYLVDNLSEATAEVYFGSYDEVRRERSNFELTPKRNNRGGSHATNGGTSKIIKKGEVWINTETYRQSTIKHEILHIIGFGHSKDENSIMHSPSRFLELSADDEFMIKTLYNPSIKAKFSESQTRSAVKDILK